MRIILFCIASLLFTTTTLAQINFTNTTKNDPMLLNEMDSLVTAGKYERITSILVAKDGQLVYEKYYRGNAVDSKHNTRSCTKTMATLLTGMAIDKGYVGSEKDKIMNYLQHKKPYKNPDPRKENITIEDLLTMSSVLECDDNNWHSRGHEERMYFIEDWTQFLLDLPVRSYPFGPSPEEAPYGRVFAYGSAKAAAVAEILQSAIGRNLVEFTKSNLFQPLGIEDYTLHTTPQNILNTAGGSEYRSRDLLKLIQLCLNEGRWNGSQLIPAAWIKKATTPRANAYEGVDYGYFLWLKAYGENGEYPSFYMSGNGGNRALAIPDLGLSVVITTTNYNNRNAHRYSDEIIGSYIIPAFKTE